MDWISQYCGIFWKQIYLSYFLLSITIPTWKCLIKFHNPSYRNPINCCIVSLLCCLEWDGPPRNNDQLLCSSIWCEIIYRQYVTIITVTNVCSRQTMSPPIIKKIQFEQGFIKESTSLKIQCCIMYLVITLPACLWHVWAFFNKPPGSWDSAEQADRLRSWDSIVIVLYLQSTRNPGCPKKNANMVNIHNYSIEGVSCLTASLRAHTQKINLWISSSASRSQRASSISQNKRNSITLHCALFPPTATLFSL